LDADKIAAFLAAAERYGFADWEGSYVVQGAHGYGSWQVEITFTDGTKKISSGSGDHPENWPEMAEAFRALTGRDIL
jgi:hypothetical protein